MMEDHGPNKGRHDSGKFGLHFKFTALPMMLHQKAYIATSLTAKIIVGFNEDRGDNALRTDGCLGDTPNQRHAKEKGDGEIFLYTCHKYVKKGKKATTKLAFFFR